MKLICVLIMLLLIPVAYAGTAGGETVVCRSTNYSRGGLGGGWLSLNDERIGGFAMASNTSARMPIDLDFNTSKNAINMSMNVTFAGITGQGTAGILVDWASASARNRISGWVANETSHTQNLFYFDAVFTQGTGSTNGPTTNTSRAISLPTISIVDIASNETGMPGQNITTIFVLNRSINSTTAAIIGFNTITNRTIGNCTVADPYASSVALKVRTNTSEIIVFNYTNKATAYTWVAVGACTPLYNISYAYQTTAENLLGVGYSPLQYPILSLKSRVNLSGAFLFSEINSKQYAWYANDSTFPVQSSFTMNDTTVLINDSAYVTANFTEDVCETNTAQIIMNVSGTFALNNTLSSASAGFLKPGGTNNYTILNVSVPLNDSRICNSNQVVAVQFCDGSGNCVNSSNITFIGYPFVNWTQGGNPRALASSCPSDRALVLSAPDDAFYNATFVMPKNTSGNFSSCPYEVTDTKVCTMNMSGDECRLNCTGIHMRSTNSTIVRLANRLSQNQQFPQAIAYGAAGTLVIVGVGSYLYLRRRKNA